jgi:HlyD family secretion protein
VTRIADRAEFTPRNVQTEEGRRTTVFAVTLSLDDLSGRLKPGMPADVNFELITGP